MCILPQKITAVMLVLYAAQIHWGCAVAQLVNSLSPCMPRFQP